MKFWQKSYFLTLLIVTVTLLCSVTVFVSVTRGNSFTAESEKLLERQHAISVRFSQDAAAVMARKPEALPRFAENFTQSQLKSSVYMQIKQNGKIIADTLPKPNEPLFEIPAAGSKASAVRVSGENHYFYVGLQLPEGLEQVLVLFAFDIEPFYSKWEDTTALFALLGALLFVILAAALYIVMRGISKPLEGLAGVAEAWANGNYSIRSNSNKRDEVGRLACALDAMAQRVEQDVAQLQSLVEQKQQLVDNLAHELHTPLTAVKGYAEYLQNTRLSDDDKIDATGYIISEASRLISLSERLLQMASLRDEQACRQNVNVNELLESAARAVSVKAGANGVIISTECIQNLTICGEKALLESLLVNLADNAIKACSQGGSVMLKAQQSKNSVVLTVSDSGCGMNGEALGQIGEEFYRPDKARSRENGGAGLGVALCRAIVKAHNADMQFQSKQGKGTTVTIYFNDLQSGNNFAITRR